MTEEAPALQQYAVRHRPQNPDDLLGSESLRQRIEDRVRLRDEHAFLITGPYGCGKTTIAKMLAYGYARQPYGQPTPDIHEINAGINGSKDDMRKLVEVSRFLPSKRDGRKVIWIEEAHLILAPAAGPLLRAVEESPPTTVWLFATNEPWKMLPTLVSRCYSFEVTLADPDELRGLLLRVLRAEGQLQDWDKRDRVALANGIVKASGQIPRTALQMLKQAVDAAPDYNSVKELLKSEAIRSPQVEMDKAAIKIVLALLLRWHKGKDLTAPIFRAVQPLDGYGLLRRLLWYVNAIFFEAVTGDEQPGTYLFKSELQHIKSLVAVDREAMAAPLGMMLQALVAVQQGNLDFTVDPKMLLTTGLLSLHTQLGSHHSGTA